MARIHSIYPEDRCEVIVGNGWFPERVPNDPPDCYSPDDLLAALVRYSDGQGRFYGDPCLVRFIFWRQPDLTVEAVEDWILQLVERGDLRPSSYGRREGSTPQPLLIIEHRARFDRWRNRQWIPLATRKAVMARDAGVCQECGTTEDPSIDHIVPYSHGGADTIDNLRVLCRPCNSRKGNRV